MDEPNSDQEEIYDQSGSDEEEDGRVEEMEEDVAITTGTAPSEPKVYLPVGGAGNQGNTDDEEVELVHEPSAYVMYHQAQLGAPCLSFDIVRDALGDNRTDFPMTAYLVAGTQAAARQADHVILVKMTQLVKTLKEDSGHHSNNDDDDSSSEELEDEGPSMDTVVIQHEGGVNRIRVAPLLDRLLVATWSARGRVNIWDLTNHRSSLDNQGTAHHSVRGLKEEPLYSFSGHQSEGYALDWSSSGQLLTGDCNGNIHLWQPQECRSWRVDQRPFTAHSSSVEDIQWSPNEATVFASCSVDKTIRIWDVRVKPSKACMITANAHSADVNVISWNRSLPLIVSGGDDGLLKIWDLRQLQKGEAVSLFKHHSGPVCSVEWHNTDNTVFASAGEDDQLVQWDIAVEKDDITEDEGVPPQLLFIHQGQKEIKELHWHPQLPGVTISTSLTGFDIFKTISV